MSALVYTSQHRRVRYAHTASPRPPRQPLFWVTIAAIGLLWFGAWRVALFVGSVLR